MKFSGGFDFAGLKKTAASAAEDALDEAADIVFRESQDQVPVDTGELKDSGVVEKSGPLRRSIRYTADIAIIAHENMTVSHTVGSAKYLETPMNEKSDEVAQLIADTIRSELGS